MTPPARLHLYADDVQRRVLQVSLHRQTDGITIVSTSKFTLVNRRHDDDRHYLYVYRYCLSQTTYNDWHYLALKMADVEQDNVHLQLFVDNMLTAADELRTPINDTSRKSIILRHMTSHVHRPRRG